jgi:hypothetical protein
MTIEKIFHIPNNWESWFFKTISYKIIKFFHIFNKIKINLNYFLLTVFTSFTAKHIKNLKKR